MTDSTPQGREKGAGERARELAAGFDFGCTGVDDHDDYDAEPRCHKCEDMRKRLTDLLATSAREARLEALEQAAHICDSAGDGTVEQMCVEGRSETWKILAEQSVKQYYSIARNIRGLK